MDHVLVKRSYGLNPKSVVKLIKFTQQDGAEEMAQRRWRRGDGAEEMDQRRGVARGKGNVPQSNHRRFAEHLRAKRRCDEGGGERGQDSRTVA